MKKKDDFRSNFESSISTEEAKARKARAISNIVALAEQGDEEENKGRS